MNRCEKDVDALNIVIERSKSAYQKTGRAYKRSAVATLVAGLVFFALGILPIVMNGKYDAVLMAILGLVLILWAYFSYKSGKQIESREGNP